MGKRRTGGAARVKDGWLRAQARERTQLESAAGPRQPRAFGRKQRSAKPAPRDDIAPRRPVADRWRIKSRVGANIAAGSDLLIWATIGATVLAGVLAYLALQLVRL